MKIKSTVKKIESIPLWLKGVVGTVIVASLAHTGLSLVKKNDVTQSSVMIVRSDRKSGGTGIILSSSNTESTILTNSHVCRVIENGGLIVAKSGEHRIFSFKHSQTHDLCLVKVKANLGINTAISNRKPRSYYEKAFISGHPSLLPNVVTSGHFSGNMIIQVLTGFKKCEEEDFRNPDTGLLCLFMGGFPIVKEYESTLVTATIMPGSSGSGVYNDDMELSGVAFAGSGQLGYAWTVPFEDMHYFLDVEQEQLIETRTPNELDIKGLMRNQRSEHEYFEAASKACSDPNIASKIKNVCDLLNKDTLWRQ